VDREQRKVETDAEAPARQAEEAELEAVSVQLRCTITEFLECKEEGRADQLLLPMNDSRQRKIAHQIAAELEIKCETRLDGDNTQVVLWAPEVKRSEAQVEEHYAAAVAQFVQGGDESMLLPKMNSFERNVVHRTAEKVGVKSTTQGKGSHKAILLTRN